MARAERPSPYVLGGVAALRPLAKIFSHPPLYIGSGFYFGAPHILKRYPPYIKGVGDLAWRKALTAELRPKGRLQLLLKAFCATGLGVGDLAWREGLTAELSPKGGSSFC